MSAPIAVAVLRTLRTARQAALWRRPLGRKDLLRLYWRHLADLAPDRFPTADDPGYRYILLVSMKLARIDLEAARCWRTFRPHTAAFRRMRCGPGAHQNNGHAWPAPSPHSAWARRRAR